MINQLSMAQYSRKHLSAFVAVGEELNFHRAAQRLAMAQPAVSRLIFELEERLAAKLLERTTRKVRLTEVGRYLLEQAQDILNKMDVAENTVRLLASGTKAILRVGYTTISGHSLVPDITREFRKSNPEVQVELMFLTSPRQRDKIIEDEIDFGFIDSSFESPKIETLHVATHRLMALVPPEHPLAARSYLTIDDLAKEVLVMGTNSEWPVMRRIIVETFQKAGRVMTVGQEASSLTGILGLVTAGVGITIFCGVPRFCGEHAISFRPIVTNPEVCVETYLAWRSANITGAMQRFIRTSEEVAKKYEKIRR
jgi:LysR family transcriptional regulator, benzoate and cis,cis-muconate-responsive activator of ben and cat genes